MTSEAERLALALETLPMHDYQGLSRGACKILTEATAELRRLSADAQRYAWLRENCIECVHFDHTDNGPGNRIELMVPFESVRREGMAEQWLDAAIDQAIGRT